MGWFGIFKKETSNNDNISCANIVNSRITINGKTITSDNTIIIDGIEVKISENNKNIIVNVNGNVNNLNIGVGDVNVNGDVNMLTSNVGDVTIEKNVSGDVKNSTGDIRINGNVNGSVKTNVGDVKIKNNGVR